MFRRLRKPFVILHFCCDPNFLNVHPEFLCNLGYRVVNSTNGFEAIQLSASGKIDALVLELDRNHPEVLLIAQEIKRLRASIPTIVLVHATQIVDGLGELADALVLEEIGSGMLVKSLEEVLLGKTHGIDLQLLSADANC
jgi:DNA-binding response OmpR family regulator